MVKQKSKLKTWHIVLIVVGILAVLKGGLQFQAILEPEMISYTDDRVIIETGRFKVDYPKDYQALAELKFLDAQNCWETHKMELGVESRYPNTILVGKIAEEERGFSRTDTIEMWARLSTWDTLMQNMNEAWFCKPAEGMCCNAHEFTHHMTNQLYMPAWASEGLATYIEFKEPYIDIGVPFECKENGYERFGEIIPYKDLSSFSYSSEGYKTAACFWRMIEGDPMIGGQGTVKEILQNYPDKPQMVNTNHFLNHTKYYADIYDIDELFGLNVVECDTALDCGEDYLCVDQICIVKKPTIEIEEEETEVIEPLKDEEPPKKKIPWVWFIIIVGILLVLYILFEMDIGGKKRGIF